MAKEKNVKKMSKTRRIHIKQALLSFEGLPLTQQRDGSLTLCEVVKLTLQGGMFKQGCGDLNPQDSLKAFELGVSLGQLTDAVQEVELSHEDADFICEQIDNCSWTPLVKEQSKKMLQGEDTGIIPKP